MLALALVATLGALVVVGGMGPWSGGPAGTPTPAPTRSSSASAIAIASDSLDPAASPTIAPAITPWSDPSTPAPSGTPATGTWTFNLFNANGVRYQDPDMTACEAATTVMMLNMAVDWTDYTPHAAGQKAPLRPRDWKVNVSYATQEAVLAYERHNTTQVLTDGGADAHGWRNALNYYGWGHNGAGVYDDLAFTSFDQAARATVTAIALYRKPVGILAQAGVHAQVVTGYRVVGEDPRTGSPRFTIAGIYLTDPIKGRGVVNRYVSIASWQSSSSKIFRFVTYKMTNSPYVDPIDGQQGNAEWDGKWVLVAPVA